MKACTKNLIVASCLTLIAMPFLYIGGQNGNATLIAVGFLTFCIGMAMAPFLYLRNKAEATKCSSPADRKASS